MSQSTSWGIAQPQQYKILWGLIYKQIASYFGYPASQTIKKELHEEFKTFLGVETTQCMSDEEMRMFIWEVVATCAIEFGLYIILPNEPTNADELSLQELWE